MASRMDPRPRPLPTASATPTHMASIVLLLIRRLLSSSYGVHCSLPHTASIVLLLTRHPSSSSLHGIHCFPPHMASIAPSPHIPKKIIMIGLTSIHSCSSIPPSLLSLIQARPPAIRHSPSIRLMIDLPKYHMMPFYYFNCRVL